MKQEGPIFSVIIRPSTHSKNTIILPINARRQLPAGHILFSAGPDETPVFAGKARKSDTGGNRPVICHPLFSETHELLPELPLNVGDKFIFEVRNGKVHILSIVKGAWNPENAPKNPRTESPVKYDVSDHSPPPKLPENPEISDLARAFVQWMQDDPFQRVHRQGDRLVPRGRAKRECGWDFRLQEFSTSKSWVPTYRQTFQAAAPVRERMKNLREKYDWSQIQEQSQIDKQDLEQLTKDIDWTMEWAEYKPLSDAAESGWAVVASAVTGKPLPDTPVSAKWSRIAALASEGLPGELTGWDSRISASVIWRIDNILVANNLTQENFKLLGHLRSQIASGGSRPRKTTFRWRRDFPPTPEKAWASYFAISEFVRTILAALNDPANNIPRMPLPDGTQTDWDMFGLNLVLHMDGF